MLYAREGARVLAVDRRIEAAEETRALIEAEGGLCAVFAADVARSDEVRAMTDYCVAQFGAIEISRREYLRRLSEAIEQPAHFSTAPLDWRKAFDTDV